MTESDVVKLRMKVEVHELEAEGPRDWVAAQLDTWKRLAGLAAADTRADSVEAAPPGLFAVDAAQNLVTLRLDTGGRRRNADAALLILYGYRTCFPPTEGADVPALRLKAALSASGYRPKRVDRAIASYVAAGWVHKSGSHKNERYALTAVGHAQAAALARRLSGSR